MSLLPVTQCSQHLSFRRIPLERLAAVPVSGMEGSFLVHEDDFVHLQRVCPVLQVVKQLVSQGVLEAWPAHLRKFWLHKGSVNCGWHAHA